MVCQKGHQLSTSTNNAEFQHPTLIFSCDEQVLYARNKIIIENKSYSK